MQSRTGSFCSRRCSMVVAVATCRCPLFSRTYSAPAYPVNTSDLPDPRGSKPDSSSQAPYYNTDQHHHYHRTRDGGAHEGDPDDHSHKHDSSNGHPTFAKLDLRNPPQMPLPTYYATYEEYLEAYDLYLKDTDHFTTSARAFLQKRFANLRATQAGVADVVRSEYLWTFIPLLFSLSVFMVDRSNHSAALFTHRVIKERTKQQVKHVKWETV